MEGGPRGYFGADSGRRKRYYGVKRMIGFQKKFPLSQYSYAPLIRGGPLSLQTYGTTYKAATPEQRAARKEFMMSGRGKYAMQGRGGYFGRMLGGLIGQADLGDKLGDAAWSVGKQLLPSSYSKAGDALFGVTDRMSGQGLYRGRGAYATNNLVTDGGATASNVVPNFNPSDMHTITYSNREFVRDIYAPAAGTVFQLENWSLNPGLTQSFPWLSQIALNFEEYEFIQLAYTYKSTVADFASASGQVGQVAMATQYNPNSDPFADKEEMMLYEGGMSCKTTESLIHGIECDPSKLAGAPQKYVRAGNLPTSEDVKNYDLGRTSIAVLNVPSTYAGQQIGELWVSYTVRLRKPKLVSANAYNVRIDQFTHYNTTAVPVTQSVMSVGTILQASRNSFGSLLTPGTNSTLTPTTSEVDNLNLALVPPAIINNTGLLSRQVQFTLTFPPDYSGVVCVRVQVTAMTGYLVQGILGVVTKATNTIKRFRDIPQITYGATTPIWTHLRETADEAGLSSEVELHLRVLPAFNGVSNTLIFYASNELNASGSYSFPRIKVEQYNTFPSVSDNGSNDKLDLITTSGTPGNWASL